jgi:rubrerythrin
MHKSVSSLIRSLGPGLLIALAAFTVSLMAVPPAQSSGKTLGNLMAAFNGESNAHARYLAFAEKADEEGYGEVASLFRAAARAEEIHANNHAEVIRKMGGVPKADVQQPDIKTTAENLQAAIEGESYERDTMYPEFISQARSERNRDALRSFNYALSAETEHAKLYTAALNNLDTLKGSQAQTYYVCTVCGYTTAKLDFTKCPSCFNPVDDVYVKIS